MAIPYVFTQLPPAALFQFPPRADPATLPPPLAGSFAHAPPVSIPDRLFAAALDFRVPLAVAASYALAAKLLNRYNRSTGRRPWSISRSRYFFYFVVFHNVLLAVYSAWTWWGMLGALRRVIANPFDKSGDGSTTGWAAMVDSACRLNGDRGLGNGLYYNDANALWLHQSATNATAQATLPYRTQTGRLWNEGLAFYGWIFYISKFYEVVDTFIILAKGKYSSTLQTYHHAGAMFCMWAGMRYMSAPIWMFVFMNSAIHTLMYTYFTVTTFSIRVPTSIKRTLTTMQILQFVIGATIAMAHSFVYYIVPATTPVAQAASASADAPAGSASLLGSIKNFLGGASAGSQAVAGVAASQAAAPSYQAVPCIASTGETFAIWLNVVYLAPLTYLFVKFFITSYVRRSNAEIARAARAGKKGDDSTGVNGLDSTIASASGSTLSATLATTEAQVRRRLSNVGNLAEQAGWDAAMNLEQEMYGASGEALNTDEQSRSPQGSHRSKKSKGRSRKAI